MEKFNKIPRAPKDLPSFNLCIRQHADAVFQHCANYDNTTELQSNGANISWTELGKVASLLLREHFREHLEATSSLVFHKTISSFSKTEFWKDYEKSEWFKRINLKILKVPFYTTKYDMEQFIKIQHLTDISDPELVEMRSKVNSTFYQNKKRIFQYMFRKVPDIHQNVVLLRRIIAIWPQMEEHLLKEGKEEPGEEILGALCRTWHLNTLRFPKFSILKRDWQKHKHYLETASEEYQKDPIYEWNLAGYEKDICGSHIHREQIWPLIVSQLRDTNPEEYTVLAQSDSQSDQPRQSRQSTMDQYFIERPQSSQQKRRRIQGEK